MRLIKGFNQQLKSLTQRKGLSLREVARRSGFAISTLSAQLSSLRLPTEELLSAWVQTCEGDVEDWLLRRAEIENILGDNGTNLTKQIKGARDALEETQTIRVASPGIELTVNVARHLKYIDFMTQVPGDGCIIDVTICVRPAPGQPIIELVPPVDTQDYFGPAESDLTDLGSSEQSPGPERQPSE